MTFEELYEVLKERKNTLPEGSTTTEMMTKGFSSILPKLNEESFEVAMALEFQEGSDVALEVSQCFYYILCIAVFMDEPFSSLKLEETQIDIADKHKLSKKIAQCAAEICHTPCLATINQMPAYLFHALKLGGSSPEQMYSTL